MRLRLLFIILLALAIRPAAAQWADDDACPGDAAYPCPYAESGDTGAVGGGPSWEGWPAADGYAPSSVAPPHYTMAEPPDDGIAATRMFVESHRFPPQPFAAYGILAFPARATAATRARHLTICEAYLATLPEASDLMIPPEQQMVTVWPVDGPDAVAMLNQLPRDQVCEGAVDRYDLATALYALRDAQRHRPGAGQGRGPFLLAWSPSSARGRPDALVLVADLSLKSTPDDIEAVLRHWRDTIELRPELWDQVDGWNEARLRDVVRAWADRFGPALLDIFI